MQSCLDLKLSTENSGVLLVYQLFVHFQGWNDCYNFTGHMVLWCRQGHKFFCATPTLMPVMILVVGDLFTMLENSEEGRPNGSIID